MTHASTLVPGLEMRSAGSDTDTRVLGQEQPQDDAFPYVWYGNWDESEVEPLISWSHLNWLCTRAMGGSAGVSHLVIMRTDAPERDAQVFGDSAACIVEVRASGRMQRVRRPGPKGTRCTLIGSDGSDDQAFTSEVFDSREAATIARRWLELGLLDGLGRRHVWY